MTRWSNSEHDKTYQSCYCLHVRVGTILLALWKILTQVSVLALIVAVLFNPHLFPSDLEKQRVDMLISVVTLGQQEGVLYKHGQLHSIRPISQSKLGKDSDDFAMSSEVPSKDLVDTNKQNVWDHSHSSHHKTSLFERFFRGDNSREYGDEAMMEKRSDQDSSNKSSASTSTPSANPGGPKTREDHYVALAVTLFWLSFSLLLLLGTFSGRPSYLMPFFCLQVFDFVITCLNVVGYFTYLPDIKRWIRQKESALPYKDVVLMLDPACLTFLVMCLALFLLALKSYLLGVVWACYKFLVRRVTGLELGTGFGPTPRLARLLLRTTPAWLYVRRITGYGLPMPGVSRGATNARTNADLWPRNDPEAECNFIRTRLQRIANANPPETTESSILQFTLEMSQRESAGLPPPPLPAPLTQDPGPSDEGSMAPPKYDEVLKIPANAYMPPPYFKGKSDEE